MFPSSSGMIRLRSTNYLIQPARWCLQGGAYKVVQGGAHSWPSWFIETLLGFMAESGLRWVHKPVTGGIFGTLSRPTTLETRRTLARSACGSRLDILRKLSHAMTCQLLGSRVEMSGGEGETLCPLVMMATENPSFIDDCLIKTSI
jgi:hypothetical protein